jgi:predicted O-methyltransferase YrrM
MAQMCYVCAAFWGATGVTWLTITLLFKYQELGSYQTLLAHGESLLRRTYAVYDTSSFMDDLDVANSVFMAALTINPESHEALYGHALTLNRLGLWESAMVKYRAMIELRMRETSNNATYHSKLMYLKARAINSFVRVHARHTISNTLYDESEFVRTVSPLYSPGYGTEQMSKVIYSVIKFTRPSIVLEIGMGYTTPFILKALRENDNEVQGELDTIKMLKGLCKFIPIKMKHPTYSESMPFYSKKHTPRLIVIDDMSLNGVNFVQGMDTLKRAGLHPYLHFVPGSYVNASSKLNLQERKTVDTIWFDAKTQDSDLSSFLREYWPILKRNGGVLLVHFTAGYNINERVWWRLDVRKMIQRLGLQTHDEELEQIQLIEPHKYRQGAVTMVKRMHAESMKVIDI